MDKYRLNELINNINRGVPVSAITDCLKSEYGITPERFLFHRRITLDSNSTIKEDDLEKYAHFFQVSPDEIRNYAVEKKTTISDIVSKYTGKDKIPQQINVSK